MAKNQKSAARNGHRTRTHRPAELAVIKSRALPLFAAGVNDASTYMKAADAIAYDVLSRAINTAQGSVCGTSLRNKLGMLQFMERIGKIRGWRPKRIQFAVK